MDNSLLPMEGGGPKGRRLDEENGMKDKWERLSQVRRLREHPSAAGAVLFPQWGRLRYEDAAIPISSERIYAYVEKQYRRTKPSPRGEGGERSEPDRVLAV